MLGTVDHTQTQPGFFGASSASSFMKQVKDAIDSRSEPTASRSTKPDGEGKVSLSSLMPQGDESTPSRLEYTLPSRRTTDSLMQAYWDLAHPLYPFIHRRETEEIYKGVWSGEGSDSNLNLCLLHGIFALATQMSSKIAPEKRQSASHGLFLHARVFLYNSDWESGSLQTVQCLLLMSKYLQSTNDPQKCWMVVGMAVRLAQSLGLHLEQTVARLKSVREQELVRKVWTGCVLLDRSVCMTLGRPGMISRANAVALKPPLLVDEDHLDASRDPLVEQGNRPSVIAFWNHSLSLYEIINEILVSFYNPLVKARRSDRHDLFFGGPIRKVYGQSNYNVYQTDNATVLQLDAALEDWKEAIPEHLRLYAPENKHQSFLFQRQANVLWLR